MTLGSTRMIKAALSQKRNKPAGPTPWFQDNLRWRIAGRASRTLAAILFLTIASFQPLHAARAQIERRSADVSLETPTGVLSGTLLLPEGAPPYPVVLIIAGSGRTDRDGNSEGVSGKSDCLRQLAEGLARGGIASLRYDKRGVGGSKAARVTPPRFETIVDDAAGWVAWLGRDSRFNGVGVIGHSEGALIGTLAAARGVRALVSLAGGGRNLEEVMSNQLQDAVRERQLNQAGFDAIRGVLKELRDGRAIPIRPKGIPDWAWSGLLIPEIQPYLISLFRFDPAAELAKLSEKGVRILVVRGTTDLMGPPEEAFLLANAIGAKPVLISGMNHELKSAPPDRKGNDAASDDPSRPLAPGLLDALLPFLKTALR